MCYTLHSEIPHVVTSSFFPLFISFRNQYTKNQDDLKRSTFTEDDTMPCYPAKKKEGKTMKSSLSPRQRE
jgi:hypothetical protein